jgi:hypothetical protein
VSPSRNISSSYLSRGICLCFSQHLCYLVDNLDTTQTSDKTSYSIKILHVKFYILAVASMEMCVFWVVAPCSPVVAPSTLVVAPSSLVVAPCSLVVASSSLVFAPSSLVVALCSPVVSPCTPVVARVVW